MKINGLAIAAIVLFGLSALFSCNKEKPTPPAPQGPGGPEDTLQFTALEVGKKYLYIGLIGEKYGQNANAFQYTDDTLQLEVMSFDDRGYLINETFKYNGDVGFGLEYRKNDDFQYYLQVQNDTLWVRSADGKYVNSRMFRSEIIQRGLPLRTISTNNVQFTGWEINHFYCECRYNGFLTNYELLGQLYDQLNVIVENKAMGTDLPGETYAYSASKGIVRASVYVGMTGQGSGWDLLP